MYVRFRPTQWVEVVPTQLSIQVSCMGTCQVLPGEGEVMANVMRGGKQY